MDHLPAAPPPARTSIVAGWMSAAGYDQGSFRSSSSSSGSSGGGGREGGRDEAGLMEEIVEELVHHRGLDVAGVMQVVRKTKPPDLAARWPGWRRSCDCLLSLGFSAENVTTILQTSSTYLHVLDPETDIRRVCFYLWEDLGFESWGKIGLGLKSWQRHKYKVVTKAPDVLRRKPEGGVEDTVATLEQVGMPTKYVLDASFRFPSLLNVPPSIIFFVSAYLSSTEVGFKPRDLGTLYRRNPWLLHPRTVENLRPIVAFLKEGLGVQRVHVLLRGYPQVVLRSVTDDLQPRIVLLQSLGIPLQQIGCMVEAFPLLLALPVEEQMLPVLYYFQTELGFTRHELWMMLRSFPAVLDLSLEDNLQPAVAFLRDEVGIQDVKSFVKRLPPVLGYPVDWELRKKWTCFQDLGLGAEDLADFPGFFSYSLHDRIIPRLEYMRLHGKVIDNIVLLRVGMAGGDVAFAKEFMLVEPEEYDDYLQDYKARTKQERADRNRAKRTGRGGGGSGGGGGGGGGGGTAASSSSSLGEGKKGDGWGNNEEDGDEEDLFQEAVCD